MHISLIKMHFYYIKKSALLTNSVKVKLFVIYEKCSIYTLMGCINVRKRKKKEKKVKDEMSKKKKYEEKMGVKKGMEDKVNE